MCFTADKKEQVSIRVNLSREEKETIKLAAKNSSQSIQEFVASAVFDKLNKQIYEENK